LPYKTLILTVAAIVYGKVCKTEKQRRTEDPERCEMCHIINDQLSLEMFRDLSIGVTNLRCHHR
jgi:hypothetical protein